MAARTVAEELARHHRKGNSILGADQCKSLPHPTRPPILTSLLRGRTTLFRCTRLPSPQRSYGEAGVAIDCITGRVIDKQIEVVNE